VLSPEEAFLMTDTLKGYQDQWNLGWTRQMASKSGTTGAAKVGVHQDAWMMAYNHDIVVGGWAGNTVAGGAGKNISAFGVDTGSTMLKGFINGLPATMNDWYQRPGNMVVKGGEVYLPGTENQVKSCNGGADTKPKDNTGDGTGNLSDFFKNLFNRKRGGRGGGGG
jgi:membrane peptidoglycan carboxypeptidase